VSTLRPPPPLDLLRDRRGLAVLVDPATTDASDAATLAAAAAAAGAAALLIGGSYGVEPRIVEVARALRRGAPALPLLQFPATAAQLVSDVDAVLLLSLVSGRNAQYLIEEHVRAVGFFAEHPQVAALSTAYLLVDSGSVTSVEAVSQTRPLPADKPELVAAHVSAAMLIGMRAVYLDAGSGARAAVSPSLIRAARQATDGLLFVGGGIRTADAVREARAAGADYVVVGTEFERRGLGAPPSMRELVHAARLSP
jgi:geranylgeranylglyceryl phosphate synthase family protein